MTESDKTRMIRSPRLLLRPWREEDLEPLFAMSNDARVMEFFPSLLTREDCEAMLARMINHHQEQGFGYWAVEIPGISNFAGLLGLAVPRFEAHFTPCVEIGWRLMAEHWGRGYATEGAMAALQFGFEHFGLPEVISMTAVINTRSQRVMQKLGMICYRDEDFDHPFVPVGHKLQRHVLFRLSKHAFESTQS